MPVLVDEDVDLNNIYRFRSYRQENIACILNKSNGQIDWKSYLFVLGIKINFYGDNINKYLFEEVL
jgi:hypothetical protein